MCLCYVYAHDSLKMIVYNHVYLYITCPANDSLKMIVYNHLSVAYSKTCAFHIVETCHIPIVEDKIKFITKLCSNIFTSGRNTILS